MITIRKASDRGYSHSDWLKSFHTFSFAEYYDPAHMHFSHLRVINEDCIAPNNGFGTHSHQNMEIMTYMVSGELQHKDSMGNTSMIKAGEVQFMRAGTNVTHSEINPSSTEVAHLLQIWVMPHTKGLVPTYSQNLYTLQDKKDKLCMLANGEKVDGVFQIAQNVVIYASVIDQNSDGLRHAIEPASSMWVQVVSGELHINDVILAAGDGAGIQNESQLSFSTSSNAEFLLFHFI